MSSAFIAQESSGRTLVRLLEQAASRWPDLPYTLAKTDSGWQAYSFSRTREAARSFAAWILDAGLAKGDRVALYADGSPQWVCAEFGVFLAGMISVPLSTRLTEGELRFRLAHSGAALLLAAPSLADRAQRAAREEGLALRVVLLDGMDGDGGDRSEFDRFSSALAAGAEILRANPEAAREADEAAALVREEDTAVISYTSGTSGDPKGVMLSHLNFWTNAMDSNALFDNPYRYRMLVVLPADHSFTHTVAIFTALICAVSLYFVDARGGQMAMIRNIPLNIREIRPEFMFSVPALTGVFMKRIARAVAAKGPTVERLFNAGLEAAFRLMGDGLAKPSLLDCLRCGPRYLAAKWLIFDRIRREAFGPRIRFIVSGGSKLDIRQERFFAAIGVGLYQGYGLTEAAPVVASNTPRRRKFGTVGAPAPSVRCRIVDDGGRGLPAGEIGEIAVARPNVMKGYFRNPAASSKVLRGGELLTGDLGYLDNDGFLVVTGRKRALLVDSDGEKFSPEAIEEAILSASSAFSRVIVWCLYQKYPCALVDLDVEQLSRTIKLEGDAAAGLLQWLSGEFFSFAASSASIPTRWTPRTFQILPKPLSEADGTINSSLKIVRGKVESLYADLLEYSYTEEGCSPLNPRNLQILQGFLDHRHIQ